MMAAHPSIVIHISACTYFVEMAYVVFILDVPMYDMYDDSLETGAFFSFRVWPTYVAAREGGQHSYITS